MIQRLLKNSAIYGLAPYVPKIISFLLLPILTKYLTDTDFGIYGTISAYQGLIATFSTLGFQMVLTPIFFRSPNYYKFLWRQIYAFLQIWMIIFCLAQSILLYFVIPLEAQEYKWIIIFFTNFSTAFFGPTALLGTTYYQLNQKPTPIAIRSIISGFFSILATYVLIVEYKLGYLGWYVGSFVGQIIVNISYWHVVNIKLGISPIWNFKYKTILNSLRVAMPSIPHYYSTYLIGSSNRLVMSRMGVGIAQIGTLSFAQQISNVFDSFVLAFNQSLTPMVMSEYSNNNYNKIYKCNIIYYFIVLLVCFTFSLFSKEIFNMVISNEELKNSYKVVIFLVMGFCFRPLYVAATNKLFYLGLTIDILKISFISGLLAFFGYCIAIPFCGIIGAVLFNYIALMYMGVSGFFLKAYRVNNKEYYPYWLFLFMNIFFLVFAYMLVDLFMQYKLIIYVLTVTIIVFIYIKLVTKK